MPSQILKPCKCGGEPFFAVERISSFGEITAWSVRCRNVSCPCYLYGHWWPTQEAAINDWNRRMEKGNETSPRLSRCARLLRRQLAQCAAVAGDVEASERAERLAEYVMQEGERHA